ncbi:hypothetical protein HDV06_004369 [Boothiomyces sp. JEL0866]|nr:hypothetical protein HDV06_004369 [Boothiomyces sp. JEL0866]
MTIESTPVKLPFSEPKRRTPGPAGAIIQSNTVKKQKASNLIFEKSDGWERMLRTVKDYEGMIAFLSQAIKDGILEARKLSKIERLIVIIKDLQKTEEDYGAVFCDPTGIIKGTIHRQVQDSFGDSIKVGTVFELTKVTLFKPAFNSQYLNVTLGNLKRLFPEDGNNPIEVPTQKWNHYHHDLKINDKTITESKYFVNPSPKNQGAKKPNYRKKQNRNSSNSHTSSNSIVNPAKQRPRNQLLNAAVPNHQNSRYSKRSMSNNDIVNDNSLSLHEMAGYNSAQNMETINSSKSSVANSVTEGYITSEQKSQGRVDFHSSSIGNTNQQKRQEEDDDLFNEIPDEWLSEI